MKKLILILGFIVAGYCSASAQWWFYDEYIPLEDCVELRRAADYGYHLSEPPRSYTIYFFKEEKAYKIAYSLSFSHDQSRGILLSSGFFKRSGKNVYLHDTATGLKMKAVIKGGKLTFVEGYELLEGKVLGPSKWLNSTGGIILPNYGIIEIIRGAVFKSDWPTVTPGYYRGSYMVPLDLHLNEDGTFIYGCDDDYDSLVVLQGTWSQNGNLLILHDTHTDHDFYLIGEKAGWRPMYLPGYWGLRLPYSRLKEGRLFKIQQPD